MVESDFHIVRECYKRRAVSATVTRLPPPEAVTNPRASVVQLVRGVMNDMLLSAASTDAGHDHLEGEGAIRGASDGSGAIQTHGARSELELPDEGIDGADDLIPHGAGDDIDTRAL